LWYKARTMLPAGDKDDVELKFHPILRTGEFIARNMLSWLK